MSHATAAVNVSQSTYNSSDPLVRFWKKNFDLEAEYNSRSAESDHNHRASKSDNRTSGSGLLSPPDQIVPAPTSRGMNHQFLGHQQHPSNANLNTSGSGNASTPRPLLGNSVDSMLNSNQNGNHSDGQLRGHNSSASGRSTASSGGNNTAWLQHMILNPIGPLQSNSSSVGYSAGDNGNSAVNSQANALTRQPQLQGNIRGNTDNSLYHQQQVSTRCDSVIGGASIAKQQQTLKQSLLSSQQGLFSDGQQQRQNFQQLLSLQHQQQQQQQQQQPQQPQILPLNELSSQLQLPSTRQSHQLQQQQQQQVGPTNNTNQVTSLPTPTSAPLSAQQQQQQQQQLLLLALMLQQNNANVSSVDTSVLSSALSSPEGLRLINSFLIGQQLPPIQENPGQQQQQGSHVSNPAVSGSTTSASALGVDHLPPMPVPGIQKDDALSNHQQFFLPQQPQQTQSQVLSQPQQLQGLQPPSISFLNPVAPPSRNTNRSESTLESSIRDAVSQHFPSPADVSSTVLAGINSASLAMPEDSESMMAGSKTSKGKDIGTISGGFGFPTSSIKSKKSGKSNQGSTEKSQFPRLLYCDSDDAILGEYQTLLRQQLELFEADSHDVINGTFRQGRTTPIRLGQIGLRCKHCSKAPLSARTKGSVYFSQTIKGMYQIGQNMSKVHLCERCPRLPPDIKKRMITLRNRRHRASGGRAYWIRHLREMGIYEDGTVLRAHPPGDKKKSSDGKKVSRTGAAKK